MISKQLIKSQLMGGDAAAEKTSFCPPEVELIFSYEPQPSCASPFCPHLPYSVIGAALPRSSRAEIPMAT